MKHLATLLLPLIISAMAVAQYNPLTPPSTFRNSDNALYWKNKKPSTDYWQQDVEYQIKATLNDQAERIDGTLSLTYYNNSPDALNTLFFHLYQNAFEPGSYMSQMNEETFAEDDSIHQHTEVMEVKVNGQKVDVVLDNTILEVKLNSPLMPGASLQVSCQFVTQFDRNYNGRMKSYETFDNKHFNVVHWYPRISVYDRKFGWTTDQHLGYEFYGDFGAFDVELTLPSHYVMEATGFLLNRDEVLPESLRKKLDIANFKDKPWNEAPSVVTPADGKTKTWKFHAENVHDFAWTADPSYRIGEAQAVLADGSKVMCYSLALEQHASGWQTAAAFTARVIELYSRDFGPYGYHKMIVADARDGMEYPMLTLDGGRSPGYRGLLAHEVGHNWFFGMVGNNETYRAALDEGFTEFLTSWALERDIKLDKPILSDEDAPMKSNAANIRESNVFRSYNFASILRGTSPPLNTHSSHFEAPRDYGQVYSKTGTMLYNLQYVLGEELFHQGMKDYFREWKFCHPYLQDFRQSMIQSTGVDLNWFFDQWLNTSKEIDYRISKVRRTNNDNEYKVTFKRVGSMQMPLDFSVTDRDGSVQHYHIPNTRFQKETEASILPRWTGYNQLAPTYTTIVQTNAGLKEIGIDSTMRLADVYMLDNALPFPMSLRFDKLRRDQLNFDEYQATWRPDVWYNGYDGLMIGLRLKGDYANRFHVLNAAAWFSTGVLTQDNEIRETGERDEYNRLSYSIAYRHRLRGIDERVEFRAASQWVFGLVRNEIGLRRRLGNNKTQVGINLHSLYRPRQQDLNYPLDPDGWNAEQWNNFSELFVEHKYRYTGGKGQVNVSLRNPIMFSDYSYGWLRLESVNNKEIDKLNLRVRTIAQAGAGDQWAPESQLYAAGASPEELMDVTGAEAFGIVPSGWYGMSGTLGNFQAGGGLGLRGYNNYVLPELNDDGVLRFGFASQSGVAVNTELEFNDYIKLRPGNLHRYLRLHTYAFADAGLYNISRPNEELEISQLRADAGMGMALDIRRWWKYSGLKPITLRADFPLWLNRPPEDEGYVAFRWLIGVERAF